MGEQNEEGGEAGIKSRKVVRKCVANGRSPSAAARREKLLMTHIHETEGRGVPASPPAVLCAEHCEAPLEVRLGAPPASNSMRGDALLMGA